jgi:hypothetical protein
LRNALTDADKRDDSWWKYDITKCYCCIDMAGWGPPSHPHDHRFSGKQEEVHPVVPFLHLTANLPPQVGDNIKRSVSEFACTLAMHLTL